MTPRQRVLAAFQGTPPDRVPVDFGGCSVTGMHVSVVYRLRQALGLDLPGTPVKVLDPFQMLGEIAPDLVDRLGIDTVALQGTGTFFGFVNEGWKPWVTFDGTPVLVPALFNTEPNPDGSIHQYPQGDRSAAPSGLMPHGGYYFDALLRRPEAAPDDPRVEDNLEEFAPIPDSELEHLAHQAERLYRDTDRAVFASFPGAGFGDLAWLPAPFLKNPKGIRNYDEWLISLITREDFIRSVFRAQCDIAVNNLRRLREAVGDRIQILFTTGADYGTQAGPAISPVLYRSLFLPFYRRINDWIHEHTAWKSFMHSCGAVEPLIPSFIEAGFDAINPVQCSASGMDPALLKQRYGHKLVFWGGGVDTQQTLPRGTPRDVRQQVRERVNTLGRNGGFVFAAVHNLQPATPVENLLAMFETLDDLRGRDGLHPAVRSPS